MCKLTLRCDGGPETYGLLEALAAGLLLPPGPMRCMVLEAHHPLPPAPPAAAMRLAELVLRCYDRRTVLRLPHLLAWAEVVVIQAPSSGLTLVLDRWPGQHPADWRQAVCGMLEEAGARRLVIACAPRRGQRSLGRVTFAAPPAEVVPHTGAAGSEVAAAAGGGGWAQAPQPLATIRARELPVCRLGQELPDMATLVFTPVSVLTTELLPHGAAAAGAGLWRPATASVAAVAAALPSLSCCAVSGTMDSLDFAVRWVLLLHWVGVVHWDSGRSCCGVVLVVWYLPPLLTRSCGPTRTAGSAPAPVASGPAAHAADAAGTRAPPRHQVDPLPVGARQADPGRPSPTCTLSLGEVVPWRFLLESPVFRGGVRANCHVSSLPHQTPYHTNHHGWLLRCAAGGGWTP